MLVLKPLPLGKVAESHDQGDLTVDGVSLLQAIGQGQYSDPDGAKMGLSAKPAMTQPPGTSARSGSVSGRGNLHPTARTSAPKSNPFPSPSNSVRTKVSSIKV